VWRGRGGLARRAPGATAVAVLTAAAHLMVDSPGATLALLPAEHFLYPEERFLDYLRYARFLAEQYKDRPVLLGAIPEGADPGCAWVAPGPRLGDGPQAKRRPQRVLAFHETVSSARAEALLRGGGLWNTSTVVLGVQTLWNLGWWALPAQMERLETLRQVLSAVRDGRADGSLAPLASSHVFNGLPAADLRRDLLATATDATLVLPMEGVVWSEWSGPDQVQRSLDALGRQSTFALRGAAAPRAARSRPAEPDGGRSLSSSG
jgi:mannose-1-phosphate guanylyltransferase